MAELEWNELTDTFVKLIGQLSKIVMFSTQLYSHLFKFFVVLSSVFHNH